MNLPEDNNLRKLLEKALEALPEDHMEGFANSFSACKGNKDSPFSPSLVYFERILEDMRIEIASLRARNEELMQENAQLENAIATANDMALRAESASHVKSQFLADMSHEIRTPMNAVLGMASMMEGTPLTAEQRDFVETIRQSGETLIDLINDILDFSKIEAGRVDLERIALRPRDLLAETISLLRLKAEDKGLYLKGEMMPEVPQCLSGDPTRVRQILINLVGNAIKFTHKGGITMRVEHVKTLENGNNRLRFSVIDTGIGIAPEKIERLFRPFSQLDSSVTRRYGGTGLGLAISSRLSELMNGHMWVESKIGHGSTFFFEIELYPELELPKELAETHYLSHGKAPAMDPAKVRILLAEDNPVNSKVAMLLLRRAGYSPDLAENGKQVIDSFRRRYYDVVLMDVQMPEMDGITATRKLRRMLGNKGLRPYIIALTASAGKPDQARCMDAGMDAFLPKPIKVNEMLKLIGEATLQQDLVAE